MGFKENLKAELSFQNIPVKELALRTGISKRTIDNYLRNKHSEPTAENAVKIAQALQVSAEYLVTGSRPAYLEQRAEESDVRRIARLSEQLSAQERLFLLDLLGALQLRFHKA